MDGTVEVTTLKDKFRMVVKGYKLSPETTLLLWDEIREYADNARREGFKEGLEVGRIGAGNWAARMVPQVQNDLDDLEDGEQVQEVPVQEKEEPGEVVGQVMVRTDRAFVRLDQSRFGKRLHFNKIAGNMFGNYKKADIYVRNGNLYIYPSNEGRYTVVRTQSNGHVQISCADVMDELVTKSGNYEVEKRDNHIVARAPLF